MKLRFVGKKPDPTDPSYQREMVLSKWETEGGAGPGGPQQGLLSPPELPEVPELTDAELVHLRIRVIALENMVISLLAQAPDRQAWPGS